MTPFSPGLSCLHPSHQCILRRLHTGEPNEYCLWWAATPPPHRRARIYRDNGRSPCDLTDVTDRRNINSLPVVTRLARVQTDLLWSYGVPGATNINPRSTHTRSAVDAVSHYQVHCHSSMKLKVVFLWPTSFREDERTQTVQIFKRIGLRCVLRCCCFLERISAPRVFRE